MVERYSVIGYGTFLTRGYWKNKVNLEICKISGFRRILPVGNGFPYIIIDKESSFWALKFDVTKEELQKLDYYEGTSVGFYKRIQINVEMKNGKEKKAFIYIPTEDTIKRENLSTEIDKYDKWKDIISKYHELVEKFPELIR